MSSKTSWDVLEELIDKRNKSREYPEQKELFEKKIKTVLGNILKSIFPMLNHQHIEPILESFMSANFTVNEMNVLEEQKISLFECINFLNEAVEKATEINTRFHELTSNMNLNIKNQLEEREIQLSLEYLHPLWHCLIDLRRQCLIECEKLIVERNKFEERILVCNEKIRLLNISKEKMEILNTMIDIFKKENPLEEVKRHSEQLQNELDGYKEQIKEEIDFSNARVFEKIRRNTTLLNILLAIAAIAGIVSLVAQIIEVGIHWANCWLLILIFIILIEIFIGAFLWVRKNKTNNIHPVPFSRAGDNAINNQHLSSDEKGTQKK